MSIHIITDSAADLTYEERKAHDVACAEMQVIFGQESFSAGELSPDLFWQRQLAGEISTTSQPSPDDFLTLFELALQAGGEVVYIGVSSVLSGTIQSAHIAASMLDPARIHIVDSLSGAAGQKLLTLHACRLRDEGKLTARQIASTLCKLRERVRVYASLDTLENLARSGRISKTAASIGTLAQLKPIVRITPETNGAIEVCAKAIGRHRAVETVAKLMDRHVIDVHFPIVPLFSHTADNCHAFIKRLCAQGYTVDDALLSALGPTLATHIGPGAFGAAFVEAE